MTYIGIVNCKTIVFPAVVNLFAKEYKMAVQALAMAAKITVLFKTKWCFVAKRKIDTTIKANIDLADDMANGLQVAILKNTPPVAKKTAEAKTNKVECFSILEF